MPKLTLSSNLQSPTQIKNHFETITKWFGKLKVIEYAKLIDNADYEYNYLSLNAKKNKENLYEYI